MEFDVCLEKAKFAANGPYGLDAYKAACKSERAEYNAAKFKNPMFDMKHCGQYVSRQGKCIQSEEIYCC
jgi:hypothetical protein